jgi:hypothetical protein
VDYHLVKLIFVKPEEIGLGLYANMIQVQLALVLNLLMLLRIAL